MTGYIYPADSDLIQGRQDEIVPAGKNIRLSEVIPHAHTMVLEKAEVAPQKECCGDARQLIRELTRVSEPSGRIPAGRQVMLFEVVLVVILRWPE